MNQNQPQQFSATRAPSTGGSKLIVALLLVCLAGAGWLLYERFVQSHRDAASFEGLLEDFGKRDIPDEPREVPEGELPYRVGKILVVHPGKLTVQGVTEIHPAWHKLDRSIRARQPDEVETVVHVWYLPGTSIVWNQSGVVTVEEGRRKAELEVPIDAIYVPSKPVALAAYDWKNRRLIGTWLIDVPSAAKEILAKKDVEREDLEAIKQMGSDEAVAAVIESMPEGP